MQRCKGHVQYVAHIGHILPVGYSHVAQPIHTHITFVKMTIASTCKTRNLHMSCVHMCVVQYIGHIALPLITNCSSCVATMSSI